MNGRATSLFASLFVSDATDEAPPEQLIVDASKYKFVGASKFIQFGRMPTMTAAQKTDRRGNRRYDEIRNFTASPELAANLQRVLVDLVELHLQGKQAHWNVIGSNFRDLHLQLDELVDAAREASDIIAERMRALDAVPDGRSDTVAATTSLPQFPANEIITGDVVDLMTSRTYATVDTIRYVHEAVDAVDPSTSDLLHEIIDSLEKLAWMIKSENRKI
jgi:starvation-inducible DNA-binding protein